MQTLNSEFYCRTACAGDSIAEIAEHIHLTDPYIYPEICVSHHDPDWIRFVRDCVESTDNVYARDNLNLLFCDDRIIGLACIVPCGKPLTITDNISIPISLKPSLDVVKAGYFQPLIEESLSLSGYNLVNFCIAPAFRGKGLGRLLLSHCISKFGHEDIYLDVIASNTAAVRLYQQGGFDILKQYSGFSGSEADLPCYQMLRAAKPVSAD